MGKYKTLSYKVSSRIAKKSDTVFLREDFKDLGGYDQIGRILRQLTSEGKIVKIGYGLYAKAKESPLTGNLVLAAPLPTLAKEALNKMGIKTRPSSMEQDYNLGRTTQVPTGRLIGVKGRVSRKIAFNGASIKFERVA